MARREQRISAVQAIYCDDIEYRRNIFYHPFSLSESHEPAISLEVDHLRTAYPSSACIRPSHVHQTGIDCQDPTAP